MGDIGIIPRILGDANLNPSIFGFMMGNLKDRLFALW
jgi:hypothetical protein